MLPSMPVRLCVFVAMVTMKEVVGSDLNTWKAVPEPYISAYHHNKFGPATDFEYSLYGQHLIYNEAVYSTWRRFGTDRYGNTQDFDLDAAIAYWNAYAGDTPGYSFNDTQLEEQASGNFASLDKSSLGYTKVQTSIMITDIQSIDTKAQTITASIRTIFGWNTTTYGCSPYGTYNATATEECTGMLSFNKDARGNPIDPDISVAPQGSEPCYLHPPLISPKDFTTYSSRSNEKTNPIPCDSGKFNMGLLDDPFLVDSFKNLWCVGMCLGAVRVACRRLNVFATLSCKIVRKVLKVLLTESYPSQVVPKAFHSQAR